MYKDVVENCAALDYNADIIERTFKELEKKGKHGYYDFFAMQYVEEKDPYAPPERYYEITPRIWDEINERANKDE